MATQQFVTLSNGERLATGVYNAFLRIQSAMLAATGFTLYVSSGFRSHDTQVQLFVSRYRQQATGSGKYSDVRYWDGSLDGYPGIKRWVRVSGAGTVAAPGTSLHEKASAVDWGGRAGVAGTREAMWLKQNAGKYGFNPSGYGFGEPWHMDYTLDPWDDSESAATGDITPGPTPGPSKPKKRSKNVILYYCANYQGKPIWALAGGSPGTPANWRETRQQSLANQMAAQTGGSAELTADTWDNWKSDYLAPVKSV